MIATGGQRLYANLLLTIGVVMPPRVTKARPQAFAGCLQRCAARGARIGE
jgi:hypothetical protein